MKTNKELNSNHYLKGVSIHNGIAFFLIGRKEEGIYNSLNLSSSNKYYLSCLALYSNQEDKSRNTIQSKKRTEEKSSFTSLSLQQNEALWNNEDIMNKLIQIESLIEYQNIRITELEKTIQKFLNTKDTNKDPLSH